MKGQDQLRLYLTKDVTYFERSTFGAMLDAITDRAFTGVPCPRCKTMGILDEPWTIKQRKHRLADGSEITVTLDKPILAETGKECDKCEGEGYIPVRLVPKKAELTARPMQTQSHESKGAPPEATLLRYATVSRRLGLMPRRLATALVHAYDEAGEALDGRAEGRAWSLAPLVDSGRKLLAKMREEDESKRRVEPWRKLVALMDSREADKTHPIEYRTALLALIPAQTAALLSEAERSWERLINAGL